MENKLPLVSVIIPVYKTEKYLEKCVRSVMGQTYRNLEIILVDDGSPDRCPELCDNFADEDERVIVIHKENGGLSDARNKGITSSTGDFIFFLDSDDYISEKAIEILLSRSIKCNADIVCGDYYSVDDTGKTIDMGLGCPDITLSTDEAIDYFAMKSWGAWGKLYKSEIHKTVQFPFGKIHEDEAIMFHLLFRCKTIALVSEKIYFYLQRKGSITSIGYSKRKMDWFWAWEKNTELLIEVKSGSLDKCISKTWDVALYNIGNLIGSEDNRQELDQLSAFSKKNWRKIVFNKYVKFTKKIRLLLFLISNHININCLYCRFYRAIGRMK